jgi:hypothetical protein
MEASEEILAILQYFNKTISIFSAVKVSLLWLSKTQVWIRIQEDGSEFLFEIFRLTRSFLLQGMAEAVKSPQAMFNLFNMRQEELKLRWQNLKAKLKGQSPVKDLTF